MQKQLALIFLLFGFLGFSHTLWIETPASTTIGMPHPVKIYFGEFSQNSTEKTNTDAFNAVKNFSVVVINPLGEKELLKTHAKNAYYQGFFTPTYSGVYRVVLQNNAIEVIDYTKYNFGIFKTHYTSQAMVEVTGGVSKDTSVGSTPFSKGLYMQVLAADKNTKKVQFFYDEKPLKNQEITLFLKNGWSKKQTTDNKGRLEIILPWKGHYLIEVTNKQNLKGVYKGKAYDFIWHALTYTTSL